MPLSRVTKAAFSLDGETKQIGVGDLPNARRMFRPKGATALRRRAPIGQKVCPSSCVNSPQDLARFQRSEAFLPGKPGVIIRPQQRRLCERTSGKGMNSCCLEPFEG